MKKDTLEMKEVEATIQRLSREFNDRDFMEGVSSAVQKAIIDSMRQQAIPKDQGALEKSLLDKSDRAHIFEVNEMTGEIQYGSKLPQAKFQAHRIGKPDAGKVRDAIASYVQDILLGRK